MVQLETLVQTLNISKSSDLEWPSSLHKWDFVYSCVADDVICCLVVLQFGWASWHVHFETNVFFVVFLTVATVFLSVICSVGASYGLWGSNAPWFMCWFQCYINCLFVCLLNFLPPFFPSLLSSFLMLAFLVIYNLTFYFLTYLSTPSRMDSLVSRPEVVGSDQTRL